MATNYQRGADFERRVKAKLEQDGWTVFRSAGSKSPVDLIACRGYEANPNRKPYHLPVIRIEVTFVQCKSGAKPMPRAERAALRDLADSLGAHALVATRGMKLEAA